MLILKTLRRDKELHGFAIAEAIARTSGDFVHVEEGSLYPALQRMLIKGWLQDERGRSAKNRRARYCRVAAAGSKQFERETQSYQRVTQAIALILQAA